MSHRSETNSHKRAKSKAAGQNGATEVPISRDRRLDALSADGKRATEVERSGSAEGLQKAARRLRDSGASQRILQVPQQDMQVAAEAMQKVGVGGTIKNLAGTKRRAVKS